MCWFRKKSKPWWEDTCRALVRPNQNRLEKITTVVQNILEWAQDGKNISGIANMSGQDSLSAVGPFIDALTPLEVNLMRRYIDRDYDDTDFWSNAEAETLYNLCKKTISALQTYNNLMNA